MLKVSVEEFSRVQRYMRLSDKNFEAYQEMKERYIENKSYLSPLPRSITRSTSC